jgi:hypothetical protein
MGEGFSVDTADVFDGLLFGGLLLLDAGRDVLTTGALEGNVRTSLLGLDIEFTSNAAPKSTIIAIMGENTFIFARRL